MACHSGIELIREPDSEMMQQIMKLGRKHQEPEHAADRGESSYDSMIPGKITEQRSYLRWEEPMLGINGEGRVTPLAPGCQPSVTVIGPDGEPILLNHIFKTEPDSEGAGEEGQLAIDMSPTQPHTTTKKARSCESCHSSDKALGLGIGKGELTRAWNEKHTVDLETIDEKRILPHRTRPQMEAIENLAQDWSRIVDEDGNQLQTVGHHFQLSRALSRDEQLRISRHGTCMACHQEIPANSAAINLLHHVAEYTGQLPETTDQHSALVRKIALLSAWVQVLAGLLVPATLLAGVFWWRSRNNGGSNTGRGPGTRGWLRGPRWLRRKASVSERVGKRTGTDE